MTDEVSGMLDGGHLAFGPVPSRRLGSSLGVDVVPFKTCSYSCVYCQLGRTRHMTVTRRTYFPASKVVASVERVLRLSPARPDYVTIIGGGEPTLAANLREVREGIELIWEGRIALLTNGSLFWRRAVRKDCLGFEVVLPTVSAGNADLFHRMHRPHPMITFERYLEGLRSFAKEFTGELWVEVMLVRGLNDSSKALEEISAIIRSLEPTRVHLTAPMRPPTERWVREPSRRAVQLALSIIEGAEDVTGLEAEEFKVRLEDEVEDLLAIATMHPLREEQAQHILMDAGMEGDQALDFLLELVAEGRLRFERLGGSTFYRALTPKKGRDEKGSDRVS